MNKVPIVSIVMPLFNSAVHLASTVESVLAQSFREWELILLDDGSTDGTVALAKQIASRDERIALYPGEHAGSAVARNEGLLRADPRSEYVIFLDHDDTWEPDALTTLLQALAAQPSCVAAHGLARAIDLHGRQFPGDDLASSMRARCELHGKHFVDLAGSAPTTFEAMLVKNCVVTPGTCLIRRTALASVGAFEPSLSPAEDWDFSVRLARRGDFAFVDHIILNWRRHPDAHSNTSRRWARAYFGVRRRSIQSAENTPDQRKVALALLLLDAKSQRSKVADDLTHIRLRAALRSTLSAAAVHAEYCRLRLSDPPRRSRVPPSLPLSEGSKRRGDP
jgi:glycosyltransferase involved in cell wall biosynthesis